MSNCEHFSETIVGLVAGDLPAAESADLRAHAAACEPCGITLAREIHLVAALSDLPPVPTFDVSEPALPMAPVLELHPGEVNRGRGAGHWWANARLATAVALISAAGLLWAVQLSGGIDPLGSPLGNTASGIATSPTSVRLDIRTILEPEASVPQIDDHFLALTAGIEAVVMRRPAQNRCANGLCASGR